MTQTPAHRDDFSAYPPDLTFHDLIARNRRNSVLLVLAMGALSVAVCAGVSAAVMAYQSGGVSTGGLLTACAIGVAVVSLTAGWSYFSGSKALLAMSGAHEITKADDPQLFNVVEEMSIAAGLPTPRIYLMHESALNAFATGRDPEHAAVAITTGLRQRLTRDELAGVMAHEIAHIRHHDIRLTMLVATMVGLIVMAADLAMRSLRHGRVGGGRSRGKGGGAAVAILLVVVILLAIVAPLLAKVIQFAVSRQREYLADAGAVELTRYPKGLADALRKLAADTEPLSVANRATAHLFIVNPILNARGRENLNSVFATHPPIEERVRRLEALSR